MTPGASQVGMCVSTSIVHGSVIQDYGFEHSFRLDSRIWFVVSAYFKCVALCLPILMAVLLKVSTTCHIEVQKIRMEWLGAATARPQCKHIVETVWLVIPAVYTQKGAVYNPSSLKPV